MSRSSHCPYFLVTLHIQEYLELLSCNITDSEYPESLSSNVTNSEYLLIFPSNVTDSENPELLLFCVSHLEYPELLSCNATDPQHSKVYTKAMFSVVNDADAPDPTLHIQEYPELLSCNVTGSRLLELLFCNVTDSEHSEVYAKVMCSLVNDADALDPTLHIQEYPELLSRKVTDSETLGLPSCCISYSEY